jgi:hypothetical protein
MRSLDAAQTQKHFVAVFKLAFDGQCADDSGTYFRRASIDKAAQSIQQLLR